MLLSEIGCPAVDGPDPAGAIRIGTQTLAHQGFTEDDMPAVASAIADGLAERRATSALLADVRAIRRRHRGSLLKESMISA